MPDRDVWVLLGHHARKPSELLGVYEHYGRGKQALDALLFIGHYREVELKRAAVNREQKYRRRTDRKESPGG